MTEKNELDVKKISTAVSQWTNSITDLVRRDYEVCGVEFDEYSKKCAMAAMTTIYQLVKNNKDMQDLNQLDISNLREIVGQCASLKLNANAFPRECYFQIRKSWNSDTKSYSYTVEMGLEGAGNDALLRNFGEGVDTVFPYWVIKKGDEFTYPKRKGIKITPPEWEEKGLSQKAVRVVYPVKLKDGTITYLISERESVRTNLFAHVRNNLMNETFGLLGEKKNKNGEVVSRTRYDATDEEKKKINEKKEVIFESLRKCETVDDMLACEIARPYMSGAWIDTPESMIVRKMCNNATKKFPKNYDSMANRSYLLMDETYQQVQEEIAENANTIDFEPPVIDGEVTEVEGQQEGLPFTE